MWVFIFNGFCFGRPQRLPRSRSLATPWGVPLDSLPYRYFGDFKLVRSLPALSLPAFEAQLDGLADVHQRLLARSALGDAAREDRALGHDPSVLTGSKHNGVLRHTADFSGNAER